MYLRELWNTCKCFFLNSGTFQYLRRLSEAEKKTYLVNEECGGRPLPLYACGECPAPTTYVGVKQGSHDWQLTSYVVFECAEGAADATC